MIERAHGLPARARRAIADLEARTVRADGGRLKLEWGVLNSRPGSQVEDLLWWDGERLLGFLGLYSYGSPTLELAGMVDPAARRRGIGTALLADALDLARERGLVQALLVTPRSTPSGAGFALSQGAVLEHSEYALVLQGTPPERPGPGIRLRPATASDSAQLVGLMATAFGVPEAQERPRSASDLAATLIVELDGAVVGSLRVDRAGDSAGIYGFAVDPRWQGRGIGRQVLGQVCRQLRAEGTDRIGLEVALDNENALGLYTSLGFTPVTTEDYYELPLGDVNMMGG